MCWIFAIFLKYISFTFSHINTEILKWFAQNYRIQLEVIPDNLKTKTTFLVQVAASIPECLLSVSITLSSAKWRENSWYLTAGLDVIFNNSHRAKPLQKSVSE